MKNAVAKGLKYLAYCQSRMSVRYMSPHPYAGALANISVNIQLNTGQT